MRREKSGGMKAGEKRRAARAAAEAASPDYQTKTLAGRAKLPKPPADARLLADVVVFHLAALAIEAERDPVQPPHQSREQAARIWSLCGKHLDTAKLRAELDELLVMLERKAPTIAPLVRGGEAGDSAPAAQH